MASRASNQIAAAPLATKDQQFWYERHMWPWPFDQVKVCDTWLRHGLHLCLILGDLIKFWQNHWAVAAKLGMIPVTFTFDLLTCVWCETHRYLMRCTCAAYEATRSNSHGDRKRKIQNYDRSVWHWPLIFGLEIDRNISSRHALYLCYIWSDLVIQPRSLWAAERTRQSKRITGLTLTLDNCVTSTLGPLTWKWSAPHCHLMGCVRAKDKANRPNRLGATGRVPDELGTTPVNVILFP